MLGIARRDRSARTAKPNFIMPSATILDLLHAVAEARPLRTGAEQAMQALLWGESTPVLTAAFLTALRVRGETVEELAGFARAMRAAATKVDIGPECRPLLDTCGTGGDGLSRLTSRPCSVRHRGRRNARGEAR